MLRLFFFFTPFGDSLSTTAQGGDMTQPNIVYP